MPASPDELWETLSFRVISELHDTTLRAARVFVRIRGAIANLCPLFLRAIAEIDNLREVARSRFDVTRQITDTSSKAR